jgi:hypothetical protein
MPSSDRCKRFRCFAGRFEAVADAFQVEPLSRNSEHGGGFLEASAAFLQGELNHRALDVSDAGRHRLIEADDDFGVVQNAL